MSNTNTVLSPCDKKIRTVENKRRSVQSCTTKEATVQNTQQTTVTPSRSFQTNLVGVWKRTDERKEFSRQVVTLNAGLLGATRSVGVTAF